MSEVCDGEMVAVTVATGISVVLAVGRMEAVAVTAGNGAVFGIGAQEAASKTTIRKKYFIY